MPTLFKAQNGLEINQDTPVQVTGCAIAETKANTKKHKKANKNSKKSKQKRSKKK
jgi:hypothetical protein